MVPSFNHAGFVGQTIESALSQNVSLEVIVVDDASSDRSRDVIAQYSDPRVRLLLHDENRGPAAALNTGITAARGDYITALGSDDYYLPHTLAKQLDFLRNHPNYDAVFGMPHLIDEQGRHVTEGGYREFAHPFVGAEATKADWLRYFFLMGNCLCHPAVMLRRRVHETVGLYDPRLLNLQDFDLWVRMLLGGMNFFVLPVELTARRVHGKNLSGPTVSTALRSQFEILQILKAYRTLPAAELYAIFAVQIRQAGIEQGLTSGALLSALASASTLRGMHYFALEMLYEALEGDPNADCRPLFKLSGRLDPFGLVRTVPQVPVANRARPVAR